MNEVRKREEFDVFYNNEEEQLEIMDEMNNQRYAVTVASIMQRFLNIDLEGEVPEY